MSLADRVETSVASLLDHPLVEVEAIEAAACGAFGCVRDERLVEVQLPWSDRRTLCPEHAAEYLEREVPGGQYGG